MYSWEEKKAVIKIKMSLQNIITFKKINISFLSIT